VGPPVKIKTLFHGHYPRLQDIIAKKWSVIPTQEKADQVDLVVRTTEPEIADTLNNRQTEIANTLNNEQTEEDLIISEAIEKVITKELDAEANPANSETFMDAREAIMKQ